MAEVATKKTKTKRRVGKNPWVEHVRSEAKRLGISYASAIPEAAKTYKKGQPAETKEPVVKTPAKTKKPKKSAETKEPMIETKMQTKDMEIKTKKPLSVKTKKIDMAAPVKNY
jgi:hypothetical protein